MAVLAVLGLRYPLKMLPLLFFEFLWKAIWLLAFGLPLLLSGRLGPETTETLTGVLMGLVLVPIVFSMSIQALRELREMPRLLWNAGGCD
jgi:hypothetical protein